MSNYGGGGGVREIKYQKLVVLKKLTCVYWFIDMINTTNAVLVSFGENHVIVRNTPIGHQFLKPPN